MWFPRLIAWLSVIGGLLLLVVGLASLLTGSYLAAVQGLGTAFGALVGGAILLVLLEIAERLGAGAAEAPRPVGSPAPVAPQGEAPWWMRKQA